VPADARLTQPQRRARTRSSLIDAAATVFARRGYHGASLEEVAAEAGLSKGAVYYNFESKEALFLALLDQHIDARLHMLEDLRQRPDSGASMREGARRVASSLRADRDWCLLFLEFCAQAAREPAVRRRFNARMDRVHAALETTVAALAPPGASTEHLAAAIDAVVDGVAVRAMLRPSVDIETTLSAALDLLWQGARRS
jgi:AcrR family transcriptional regulator